MLKYPKKLLYIYTTFPVLYYFNIQPSQKQPIIAKITFQKHKYA